MKLGEADSAPPAQRLVSSPAPFEGIFCNSCVSKSSLPAQSLAASRKLASVRTVDEFSAILARLVDPTAYPAALATLVEVSGSSYRRAGARLLLASPGDSLGTLSGGCLEEDVLARCARVQRSGVAEIASYDTREENDVVWGVGLGCHGVVRILIEPLRTCPDWVHQARAAAQSRQEITLSVSFGSELSRAIGTSTAVEEAGLDPSPTRFIERIPPPFRLLVFGAGEDARPLVRFASMLGWQVTVLDPRPALPTRERFPEAVAHHAGPVAALLEATTTDERTAAVIMTHHYVHDLPLLTALRRKRLAYLGLLGPRARADRLLRAADAGGDAPAMTPATPPPVLHAPVGLDLGGDGPAAVALAIVAEIQASLSGRDARPLRERRQPIHSR